MLSPAGTIIDDQYEILSTIGMGGYGVVYRAKQIKLDRVVALKMLNASVNTGDNACQRFEREAQAMGSLKHRNLVMVYGSGFWRGRPYISMEYVKGDSLNRVIEEEGRLDTKRALNIVQQILEGLACAHKHNIIHRDLKPSNVMILQRGDVGEEVVKIIDFGLAKVLPGAGIEVQKVTEVGYAVGSVMYMAPEQCLAQSVDHRSDIYAAGCILHSLLTGGHPYEGAHSAVVMMQHVQAPPLLLSQVVPDAGFPPELQLVLNKALAKLPDERYQSANDMASDLQLIASERSSEISCHDAELPQPMQEEVQRKNIWASPIVAAIIGSLSTLCVVALVYFFLQMNSPRPQGQAAIDLFKQATLAWDVGDTDRAAGLYEQGLENRLSDGSVSPAVVTEAYLRLCQYYGSAKADECAHFAEEGIKVAFESRKGIGDSTLMLAAFFMRACNEKLKPHEALPTCERVLHAADPMLSGGSVRTLRVAMAEGFAMMGRPMRAEETLAGTVTQSKPLPALDAQILKCRGEIAFLQDNMKQAESYFIQSRKLDSSNDSILPDLARTEIALGDWKAARKAASEYMMRYPGGTLRITGVLSLLAAHEGNFRQAHQLMQPLAEEVELNKVLFKGIHMDFDLSHLALLAEKAREERQAQFFTTRYERGRTLYTEYMHLFKQMDQGQVSDSH